MAALGLSWVGPPHTLRHSGASRDVATKAKSLEEVRRRGRWSQPKSVQRYTKTHLLTQHLAQVPKSITVHGREITEDPVKALQPLLPQRTPKERAVATALSRWHRRARAV